MVRNHRWAFVALVLIALLAGSAGRVGAQDEGERHHPDTGREPLKGTWQNMITPNDCATGAPAPISFPAIASFSGGGTSLSIGASTPPAARTAVLGTWIK